MLPEYGSYMPNPWFCVNCGYGLLFSSTVPSFIVLFQVSSKIFSQFTLSWALVITYKATMELGISIVQLKPRISLTCKTKAQLCEVFWPLWMLTWWSWIRIHGLVYKNNFNLCIMGVAVLYSEDSKRSCISCSGSLCSEGYEARPLIFFSLHKALVYMPVLLSER